MTKLRAVLFDFDNTLVNTACLRNFRESKEFFAITDAHIAQTKIYKPVVLLLRRLKEKRVRTGVVTNSPLTYVNRLIEHHGLGELLDVVVAYNDVGPAGKKPSATGIDLALDRLQITDKSLVAYVGDEYTDIVAAYRAGVLPVAPTWASRKSVSTPPAAHLSSACLLEMADDIEEKLLFAERCAENGTTTFERKSARFLPLDDASDVSPIRQKLRTFCLGRYFSQKSPTTAILHDRHALSLEIAKKDALGDYRPPQWMADMLLKITMSAGLYLFEDGRQVDVVTVIPKKPFKPERLELVLREMSGLAPSTIEFREDLLFFDDEAAASLRGYGSAERRLEQQHHLHGTNVDLHGKNVLVIDDVITSGATINQAIALLDSMGAESVHGIGIGKTVSIVEEAKPCPKCGRDMLISKNGATGERFWSCSGYFEEKICAHSEPLEIVPCPKCGRPLRLAKNKRKGTLFYGCTGWGEEPSCSYTRNA